MELKYDDALKYIKRDIVLIVPLWNWNDVGAATGLTEEGFNRTFMELK